MPPPTNLTALTATDLGALPADVTQNVHDAGTTYTVWYKFTAPANKVVIGAWGFGDLAIYMPTTKPYSGPAGAPVQILSIAATNKPFQFPVTAGQEYFLEFVTNGGNPNPASLRVRVEAATNDTFQAGDIMVANADVGHPAIIYNPGADYTVRQLKKDFTVSNEGSAACILASGQILINRSADKKVVFHDSSLAEVTTSDYGASGLANAIAIRGNRTLGRLYFTRDVNPVKIRYYDSSGILNASDETLTAINNCTALCMNNDATILYHAATTLGAAIRRWDMVGHVALSNLVAGIANHFTVDILVIQNGQILAIFSDGIANTTKVRRYDTSGTQLAEYNFDDISQDAVCRLGYDYDTADTHVWVWGHVIELGGVSSRFVRLRLSDGARITTISAAEYNLGVYDYTATATPLARFGNHNCCPFLVFPGTPTPPTPTIDGIYVIETGLRRDIYYDLERKIPNPTVRTALFGE